MADRYNAADMLHEGIKTIPNYILKNTARLVKPGYSGFQTPAVFRILPGVDPENPRGFDKTFLDDGAPGEWICTVPTVMYAFGKGVSFVLQEDRGDMSWSRQSPYMIVRQALLDLSKNPNTPLYVANMVNGNSKEKMFPEAKIQSAVCVLSYHRQDQDWQPRADALDVLMLGQGVALLVLSIANDQWSISMESKFDVTAPDKGEFLVMWNKEEIIEPPGIDKGFIKYQKGSFGYGVALTPTFPRIGSMYDGIGAALEAADVTAYKSVMKSWKNIIDYKPYEEQAALMCEYAPAAPLVYAWGDTHPEWLTKAVKLRANNEPRIGGSAPVQGYSAPRYDTSGYGQQANQQPRRDMYSSPIRPIDPKQQQRPAPVRDEEEEAPWNGPEAPLDEMNDMAPGPRQRAAINAMNRMAQYVDEDPM